MKAASLGIIHQYSLAFQRKQKHEKIKILRHKREADFNARLALFFGVEAAISAQGVSSSDLVLTAPSMAIELKYLRPKPGQDSPVNHWNDVIGKDWKWLMDLTGNGGEFHRKCLVFFLPNTQWFPLHHCFQVPKNKMSNNALSPKKFALFCGLASPSQNDPRELVYSQASWPTESLLVFEGGKKVLRQILGDPEKSPIWCLIFSRVGSGYYKKLKHLPQVNV